MIRKKAKIKFKHNSFDIVKQGEFINCAVSGKEISLENLNYWNVELQEPYYSYVEASIKREEES